ncbi:hypothetical protein KKF34_02865 [Myxococcota bacterium]|nr:hypothetical protein [Myxococcota bacterium]MBU1382586.1 hypothetical protein [Myxococcota bacterium]MBU1495803.1 hypothetical protein [Myxococcota bacterium]
MKYLYFLILFVFGCNPEIVPQKKKTIAGRKTILPESQSRKVVSKHPDSKPRTVTTAKEYTLEELSKPQIPVDRSKEYTVEELQRLKWANMRKRMMERRMRMQRSRREYHRLRRQPQKSSCRRSRMFADYKPSNNKTYDGKRSDVITVPGYGTFPRNQVLVTLKDKSTLKDLQEDMRKAGLNANLVGWIYELKLYQFLVKSRDNNDLEKYIKKFEALDSVDSALRNISLSLDKN